MLVSLRKCRMQVLLFAMMAIAAVLASFPESALAGAFERLARGLLSGRGVLDYQLAVEQLAEMKDPRVSKVLWKLLDSDREEAKAAAAGALWRYSTDEVRKRLVELLEQGNELVRLEAAKSLVLMGYDANLGPMVESLRSGDEKVRCRALQALAVTGHPEAAKAVESFRPRKRTQEEVWHAYAMCRLDRGKCSVARQRLARIVLAPLGDFRSMGFYGVSVPDMDSIPPRRRARHELVLKAIKAAWMLGDKDSLEIVAAATYHPEYFDHPLGPVALLRKKGSAGLEAVSECLEGKYPLLVRYGCTRAAIHLKQAGKESDAALAIQRALAVMCNDSNRAVRQAAARALARHYGPVAKEALKKLLGHEDSKTRFAAAMALGLSGDEKVVPVLMDSLGSETDFSVRRQLYKALQKIGSPRAVQPLLKRLKVILAESQQDLRVAAEIPWCVAAIGGAGEAAARAALRLMKTAEPRLRDALVEILAHSGSQSALEFFLDRMRSQPPEPEGPEVRFFDTLPAEAANRLEETIRAESAMWIRLVLARTLYKMGRTEYGRGIRWGLRRDDEYLRRLSAALAFGLRQPDVRPLLADLLSSKDHRTAWFAARALLGDGSAEAIGLLLAGLDDSRLRRRPEVPLVPFWEGTRRADHPFAKAVDNERVWVLFADNRLGRRADLFLTWSVDGKVWRPPVFTGLTSFADFEDNVAPPTFSMKVNGRQITIALTRTFARSPNWNSPRFATVQRVHRFRLEQFFDDSDGDDCPDTTEAALHTLPRRADTDADGLTDCQDKNPLAVPADRKDCSVLGLLAAGRLIMVDRPFLLPERALVVARRGGGRDFEIPWFDGLVLHLDRGQRLRLWQQTGSG
ncbi:MAG: HEAT repeat domain-containing protein, partial [Deltaproteobacteria bacterium]